MTCVCGSEMVIKKAKEGERYGTWRCNKYNCRKEKSYLAGTFFSGSHIGTKKIFLLTYWWVMKYGRVVDWMREFDLATHTITDWRNFCRDVCAQYFENNPIAIGGPGLALFENKLLFYRNCC